MSTAARSFLRLPMQALLAGALAFAPGCGANGTNGTSCTVKDNADGSKTIACTDGSTVTITDGKAGGGCSVKENGDGTKTISCADGTKATVRDGDAGASGQA